jgi:hypothetical protein
MRWIRQKAPEGQVFLKRGCAQLEMLAKHCEGGALCRLFNVAVSSRAPGLPVRKYGRRLQDAAVVRIHAEVRLPRRVSRQQWPAGVAHTCVLRPSRRAVLWEGIAGVAIDAQPCLFAFTRAQLLRARAHVSRLKCALRVLCAYEKACVRRSASRGACAAVRRCTRGGFT